MANDGAVVIVEMELEKRVRFGEMEFSYSLYKCSNGPSLGYQLAFYEITAWSSGKMKLNQFSNLVNKLILYTLNVVINAYKLGASFCHFEDTHQMLKNENIIRISRQ